MYDQWGVISAYGMMVNTLGAVLIFSIVVFTIKAMVGWFK